MLTPPISSIDIALGDVSDLIKHQKSAKKIIKALSEAPKITSLTISCGTLAQKLNFTSHFSTLAAQALAKHGMHLVNIVVSANTKGATEFAQSILTLAEKGTLETFQLTPISSEGWSSENTINDLLVKASTAINDKKEKLNANKNYHLTENQNSPHELSDEDPQDALMNPLLLNHGENSNINSHNEHNTHRKSIEFHHDLLNNDPKEPVINQNAAPQKNERIPEQATKISSIGWFTTSSTKCKKLPNNMSSNLTENPKFLK